MIMTLSKGVLMGLALVVGSTAAHATLNCPDESAVRTFHLSADPVVADLVAIPDLAEGGEGQLSMFNVQQASAEGYRDIAIDESGLVANGLEAELIDADFTRGTASFRACTDEGFLVLAIYRSKTGDIAGVPADVLGIAHEVNYANVTEQSNVRIGLEFNRGGAGRALSIIQNQLPELPGVANPPIGRQVAELVLTENVANVFDFSESQAPVFGFDRAQCVVRDHVVLHSQDGECIGQLNPAVTAVAAISATGQLETVSSGGQFTSRPNRLYQATIAQAGNARSFIFASRYEEEEEEEQEPAPATTFSVSSSGSAAYIIDGQSNPDLTLVRGETYVFDLNVTGHPFWIKESPTTGTGNAFDQGVSGNGQSSGQLTFTVPATAPDALFYICQFHGAMQGRLNIVDP